jgi:hypothetical protein
LRRALFPLGRMRSQLDTPRTAELTSNASGIRIEVAFA